MRGAGDDGWVWLALFALLATRTRSSALQATAAAADDELANGDWSWPLPMLDAANAPQLGLRQRPTISDGWGSPRDGGARLHKGVDILYQRTKAVADPPAGESRGFAVPKGVVAIAARAGKLWSAKKTSKGWRVVVDHGPLPYATVYQHLSQLWVPETTRATRGDEPIFQGQPLGLVGADPQQGKRAIRHLHFEVLAGNVPIDPAVAMISWRYLG